MGLKRKARSAVCAVLAAALVLQGRVNRAKRKSFAPGAIVPVYFHNPNKKLFRQTVAWLKKNGYSFISCDHLIDILSKKAPCPPGAVWLSLDDGWQQNIDNVIPVAVEYNIPVTIFICTEAVEKGTFWWEDVNRYARYLPAEYNESGKLRKLPEQKRKEILKSIEQYARKSPREALTIEDIRRISAIPQVTLGAHTVSHPVLNNCTDSEAEYELGESKKKLEEWIKKPVKAFAYPNGVYDARTKQILEKHGYEFAATTERKFGDPDCDLYLFPRTAVMDDGSFTENLCHLLGIWEPFVGNFKSIIRLGR
jgi:peptidoglycan/xylan/chitin deacetylase (PgdA/CDA1 family)